jgi:flagellin-like hook-associated protein FlgL
MDISAIALQGLDQASSQLDAASSSLVQASANSASAKGNIDTVDLATQVVALTSAQVQFQLNLSALKTADQIQQNILNVLA